MCVRDLWRVTTEKAKAAAARQHTTRSSIHLSTSQLQALPKCSHRAATRRAMLHAALLATGLADDLEQRCGARDGERWHVTNACGESVQFAAALTGADDHDEEEAKKDRTDGELAGTALQKNKTRRMTVSGHGKSERVRENRIEYAPRPQGRLRGRA